MLLETPDYRADSWTEEDLLHMIVGDNKNAGTAETIKEHQNIV
jgi:hypothetical protein